MKKFIVTTSIYSPTLTIQRLLEIPDITIVVAGDLKTPHDLYRELEGSNFVYLSPEDQQDMDVQLSDYIGWNNIQRRNFAILYAYLHGADLIATIDDDNIPYSYPRKDFWVSTMFKQEVKATKFFTENIIANPLSVVKNDHHFSLWSRGFPIEFLTDLSYYKFEENILIKQPMIISGLWNGVPDLDVFGHLVFSRCYPIFFIFDEMKAYTFNKIVPFNSQNTVLPREIIPDYFLFPHIGRMDDIWASYYLQAKHKNLPIVFTEPTVYQERHVHNFEADFKNEELGFKNNRLLLFSLQENPDSIFDFLPNITKLAFERWKILTN